jgi:hypothetical protein
LRRPTLEHRLLNFANVRYLVEVIHNPEGVEAQALCVNVLSFSTISAPCPSNVKLGCCRPNFNLATFPPQHRID